MVTHTFSFAHTPSRQYVVLLFHSCAFQFTPRYYTVKLCTVLQNPGFTGFLAEGHKKKLDVIFSSGIINLLFDGLTYNTRGHFAHCSILRNSQSIRAHYMLNHRIRCCFFLYVNKMYILTSQKQSKETVNRDIYVVVQFYPWLNFYFSLFFFILI